jgi:hypothetical protein
MNVSVKVNRSFSPFLESDTSESEYEHHFRLGDIHKSIHWNELLEKRMVVIWGEAGIGKTYEFRNKAENLEQDGKFAFFIPLNLLDEPDGFCNALIDHR